MLPHDLQPYGTRIWTYGYNSQIAFSGHVTNISDLANSLLGLVRNNNVGKDGRKIVWVCHSLGGLVVKKVRLDRCLYVHLHDLYLHMILRLS